MRERGKEKKRMPKNRREVEFVFIMNWKASGEILYWNKKEIFSVDFTNLKTSDQSWMYALNKTERKQWPKLRHAKNENRKLQPMPLEKGKKIYQLNTQSHAFINKIRSLLLKFRNNSDSITLYKRYIYITIKKFYTIFGIDNFWFLFDEKGQKQKEEGNRT